MHNPEPQRTEQTRPDTHSDPGTISSESRTDLPKYLQILNDSTEVVFEYPSPS